MLQLAIKGRDDKVNLDQARITIGRDQSNTVVLAGSPPGQQQALRPHRRRFLRPVGLLLPSSVFPPVPTPYAGGNLPLQSANIGTFRYQPIPNRTTAQDPQLAQCVHQR